MRARSAAIGPQLGGRALLMQRVFYLHKPDAALSAEQRVSDGVRPRVTREVRSGCVAVSLAECLVLWFCVSLLCDRHRPSCVHPYRVGVPVVGRTVFRLPINQSINSLSNASTHTALVSSPSLLFFTFLRVRCGIFEFDLCVSLCFPALFLFCCRPRHHATLPASPLPLALADGFCSVSVICDL